MSNIAYCGQCGKKSVSPPGTSTAKFCVFCGHSFLGASVIPPVSVSPTPKRQTFTPRARHQAEEEEEEFPDGLPQLNRSDFILEGEGSKGRFVKIGSLGPAAEIDGPRMQTAPEITPEAFKAQWAKDAGSSRSRGSVEIGE